MLADRLTTAVISCSDGVSVQTIGGGGNRDRSGLRRAQVAPPETKQTKRIPIQLNIRIRASFPSRRLFRVRFGSASQYNSSFN